MESLSANEAKTHFGDLLLKVQREPVQIKRNGKAVAVVISIDNYLNFEDLKMQQLTARILQAKNEILTGHVSGGDAFLDDLIAGKHDSHE